jgi:hypothetical protein
MCQLAKGVIETQFCKGSGEEVHTDDKRTMVAPAARPGTNMRPSLVLRRRIELPASRPSEPPQQTSTGRPADANNRFVTLPVLCRLFPFAATGDHSGGAVGLINR